MDQPDTGLPLTVVVGATSSRPRTRITYQTGLGFAGPVGRSE